MTDFEKIKKALADGGNIEGRNFFVCDWKNKKTISLYKSYPTTHWDSEEIETEFNFDGEGNLIEII